mmetsp:Transcript_34334/g.85072  ORF Transcript_34334/g.85072 Transcript_34334/m.85072 type:complete len:138 (-) Transcript_34334:75-488(-)
MDRWSERVSPKMRAPGGVAARVHQIPFLQHKTTREETDRQTLEGGQRNASQLRMERMRKIPTPTPPIPRCCSKLSQPTTVCCVPAQTCMCVSRAMRNTHDLPIFPTGSLCSADARLSMKRCPGRSKTRAGEQTIGQR